MISEIIMNAIVVHPAAYNPNTEFFFLEIIMGLSSLVTIGATIFTKLFIMRNTT